VIRDRNSLFRQLDDGRVENVYTVRVINKDTAAHTLRLTVQGPAGASLDSDRPEYVVGGGEVVSIPVRVRAPREAVHGSVEVQILVRSTSGDAVQSSTVARFIAPAR
jgi:polyferredoxin